jgi:chromosome segregation ATPase
MFEELRDTVTKEDFRILRESIDANVSRLDGAITRLAEAQARTEVKVGELAEGQSRLAAAQARTEERMNELAQAQARTEERMNELAQAQARTEVRMDELAHAQARTEEQVRTLVEVTQRLSNRTDEVVGRSFELQFRDASRPISEGFCGGGRWSETTPCSMRSSPT